MALNDHNILIVPNIGQSADPKIVFSGANSSVGAQSITLQAYPTNNGTLSFEGTAGQLFSITNTLSGTIYSVNDVSGIPSFEVLDTGLVKIAQYSGNVLVGTGTDNGTDKLQVNGPISGTAVKGSTLTSTVATGTAPLTVSSTTLVNNLNADLWDGYQFSTYLNQAVRTDSGPTFGEIYANGWFRNNTSGLGLYNAATTQHFYSDDDNYWNIAGGSDANGLRFRDEHAGTIRGYVYADNSNNIGFLDNASAWKLRVVGADYTLVEGSSARAPIFYDSNNTGYYVDPASTSNLNGLTVAATISGSVSGSAGSVAASGITGQTGMWTSAARPGPSRLYRNDDNSAFNVQTTWSADVSGYWSLRGYYNDTYHAPCYVAYAGYAPTIAINYNNDSNSTYQMLWGSGSSVYGTGGIYCNPSSDILYAAAFYDANDTNYYCDPNSTSRLNNLNVVSSMNAQFYESEKTITANYSITTNRNAMTAGPVTINNDVTITIPNGSVWTVV